MSVAGREPRRRGPPWTSVVGFVNALSDGRLSAYIPLLEVLPDYRGTRHRERARAPGPGGDRACVHDRRDVRRRRGPLL